MAVTGRLVLDCDVASVVKFIETEVPADRRVFVSERLSEVARLIWADRRCALFQTGAIRETPLSANECAPALVRAGDDSVAVAGADALK
jgi:hypothetical protein